MGKGELTTEQRQRELDVANRLTHLAAEAGVSPMTEQQIHKLVKWIHRTYGYSDSLKKAEILKRVRNGCSSVPELCEETGWPPQTIHMLIRELEKESRVEFRKVKSAGQGPGRPMIRIFIKSSNFE